MKPDTRTPKWTVPLIAAILVAAWGTPRAVCQDPAKPSRYLTPRPDPASSWAPPDVDASVPEVNSAAPCPLAQVIEHTEKRTEELIGNLLRFTATEEVEHYDLGKTGEWGRPVKLTSAYVAEIEKGARGMLYMKETRDGSSDLRRFPAKLATLGLPSLALIFHPFFRADYLMTCEGQGSWNGHPAWQIHFEQRADKFSRLRGYSVNNRSWLIKLKGRAWIDPTTYQPLHIETDLMEPVLEIRLLREHLAVDYQPVHFVKENEDLWLPQRAEVFMDLGGHRYRRVHTFSDFLLFSVDVMQKDAAPRSQ